MTDPRMLRFRRPHHGGGRLMATYRRLAGASSRPWTIRCMPVCSSTEELLGTWLRDQPSLTGPRALIATHQRRGVGQWGRAWVSPPGGVWISAALPWRSHRSAQAGLLGLALALSVVQRLEQRGLAVQIKWPNDLLVNGRKLAGLLPGVVQRGSQLRLLRVGLGLNVRNPVPAEGIALRRLEGQQAADPIHWTAEVLLALDHCYRVGGDGSWCLDGVRDRLWSNQLVHPENGQIWQISGLEDDGALRLRQGSMTERWRRWP
ncbi:biotin--acetyl-CoA-carboxylase ligase [Synechococcus sp. KORDI-52]|uniref:biotin--[acetyl-CoA-carboxylase] ligase n=1 Tax=Synechococcus sp. KORDI-52 TaxID=585425 RepID=UPI0004E07EE0|nr:biotin--acetyl-CoA-carboxylase ligase [Synechococcus sp. KORDI-52]